MRAEVELAGALIGWPEALIDVRPIVTAQDFTDGDCRAVFEACCAEGAAGRPWTLTSLTAAMAGKCERKKILDLFGEVVSSVNAVSDARLVHAAAVKVRLGQLLRDAMNELDETPATPAGIEEFSARHAKALESLSESDGDGCREQEAGSVLLTLAERLSEHRAEGGVLTGIDDLDQVLRGMRAGDLVVIAGRTSMGKTALGLQVALNTARAGLRTAVLSLEMPSEQLIARVAANLAGVDGGLIRSGNVAKPEIEAIIAEARALQRSGCLWMIDDSRCTLTRVHSALRRQRRRHGLDVVILDYIQRVRAPGFRERHLEVGEVTRSLKDYAKELGVPIVALAQLSRDAENARPTLAHLRESGSIEMDADVVVLLHGARDGQTITAIVAKNRDGRTCDVELAFMRSVARIADLAKSTSEVIYDGR